MMYVLFAPAQLQRQAPQRGTAAPPMQSRYQPTGWLSPNRGITVGLARTASGDGRGWDAGDGRDEGQPPAAQCIGDGSRNACAAARFAPFTRSSPRASPFTDS